MACLFAMYLVRCNSSSMSTFNKSYVCRENVWIYLNTCPTLICINTTPVMNVTFMHLDNNFLSSFSFQPPFSSCPTDKMMTSTKHHKFVSYVFWFQYLNSPPSLMDRSLDQTEHLKDSVISTLIGCERELSSSL